MSRTSETEDGYFVAMDTEEDGEEPVVKAGEVDPIGLRGGWGPAGTPKNN